jgi:hypothetical protein
MDELLQQIQSACAGLTAEEIAGQIAASQYAASIPDVDTLASFLEAIGQSATGLTDVVPDDEATLEQSGND